MSTLLEIVAEHRDLVTLYSDPDVDEQTLLDTLEGVQGELEIKAEGYVEVIKFLEAETEHLSKIIEAASSKKSTIDNNVKRLKNTIVYALQETGHDDKEGLKAGDYTLKVQGNGGKQPLKIVGDVPDNFKRIVYENDTDKIREFLKDNTCDWAYLEERGKHLAIK